MSELVLGLELGGVQPLNIVRYAVRLTNTSPKHRSNSMSMA